MNINIYKNFTELANIENFKNTEEKEKYKKWLSECPLSENAFYNQINFTYLEEYQEGIEGIKKIDIFIKEKLELYPNLYPNINLKHINNFIKNRNDKIYNDKQVKDAKKFLWEGRVVEAIKHLTLIRFKTKSIDNFYTDNSKEKKKYYDAVNNIDTQKTLDNVAKELKLKIQSKFSEYLYEDEIVILSNLMGLEIYLRTKKQWIYCKIFSDFSKLYNSLETDITNEILLEKATKILSSDHSENGIERTIKEIRFFNKK